VLGPPGGWTSEWEPLGHPCRPDPRAQNVISFFAMARARRVIWREDGRHDDHVLFNAELVDTLDAARRALAIMRKPPIADAQLAMTEASLVLAAMLAPLCGRAHWYRAQTKFFTAHDMTPSTHLTATSTASPSCRTQ